MVSYDKFRLMQKTSKTTFVCGFLFKKILSYLISLEISGCDKEIRLYLVEFYPEPYRIDPV